jgi:hypothetical protein
MVIYCHPWTALRISTAQEEHGGGRRLLRIRYRLRPTRFGALALGVALTTWAATAFLNLPLGSAGLALTIALSATIVWRGRRLAQDVVCIFDDLALELGMLRCTASDPAPEQSTAPAAGDQTTIRIREDDCSLAPECRADAG